MHRGSALGRWLLLAIVLALALLDRPSPSVAAAPVDPLPSWNEGPTKQRIVQFVADTTTVGPSWVDPSERIAVFDNDGTLWNEAPLYVQLRFALDRVKALSVDHPEWREQQPFKAALEDDVAALVKEGEKGIVEIVAATHAGMTTDAFSEIVHGWLLSARHPRFDRPYTELVYEPMLELLGFLRTNGFKTFIVTGGGSAFVRAFAEDVYRIPPEQVVGSTIDERIERRDGQLMIVREAGIAFVDDHDGKPIGIERAIGRRPLAAFGNSDGDQAMLEWTTSGPGLRFGLLVHHTDAEREFAYDRESPVGRLASALDEAATRGWAVVDMKNDWNTVFPPGGDPRVR